MVKRYLGLPTLGTCNIYTAPDSGRLPRVEIIKDDEENPCVRLAPQGDIRQSLVMDSVNPVACELQREVGACPRNFGKEIPTGFLPPRSRR